MSVTVTAISAARAISLLPFAVKLFAMSATLPEIVPAVDVTFLLVKALIAFKVAASIVVSFTLINSLARPTVEPE